MKNQVFVAFVMMSVVVSFFSSSCEQKPKQNPHIQKHEQIVTQFWQNNNAELLDFYKKYEAYNAAWTKKIEQTPVNAIQQKQLTVEKLLLPNQKEEIINTMKLLGIIELYIHMGAKNGFTVGYSHQIRDIFLTLLYGYH